MAKTVYIETGNYKIKVADTSNEITLDSALTHITRDIRVEGDTTTANTTKKKKEQNS